MLDQGKPEPVQRSPAGLALGLQTLFQQGRRLMVAAGTVRQRSLLGQRPELPRSLQLRFRPLSGQREVLDRVGSQGAGTGDVVGPDTARSAAFQHLGAKLAIARLISRQQQYGGVLEAAFAVLERLAGEDAGVSGGRRAPVSPDSIALRLLARGVLVARGLPLPLLNKFR